MGRINKKISSKFFIILMLITTVGCLQSCYTGSEIARIKAQSKPATKLDIALTQYDKDSAKKAFLQELKSYFANNMSFGNKWDGNAKHTFSREAEWLNTIAAFSGAQEQILENGALKRTVFVFENHDTHYNPFTAPPSNYLMVFVDTKTTSKIDMFDIRGSVNQIRLTDAAAPDGKTYSYALRINDAKLCAQGKNKISATHNSIGPHSCNGGDYGKKPGGSRTGWGYPWDLASKDLSENGSESDLVLPFVYEDDMIRFASLFNAAFMD